MTVSPRFSRRAVTGAVVLASALAAAVAWAARPTIPLTLPSGKVLKAEVMISDQDRAMGLMFRPALPEDQGMLFDFAVLGFHGIWMKNCRFPIDIVWLDEDRRVVHVAEAVPPCREDPCPAYEPLRQARYVIEINAGQARREDVEVGSTISFELPR